MQDILLNSEMDLLIEDGDLVISEATIQHQQLLMKTKKGDWKENPTVGVGIGLFLKDEDNSEMLSVIRQEFEKDGMRVNRIDLVDENIFVDAAY